MDQFKVNTPWISETLQPRVDIWGQPVLNREFAGVYVKRMQQDPVNQALEALRIFPSKVERKIRGVDLTDKQYHDYATTAGQFAKMRLDAYVRNPAFSTIPDAVKFDTINEIIRNSRQSASQMVLMENQSIIRAAVDAKTEPLRTGKPRAKGPIKQEASP